MLKKRNRREKVEEQDLPEESGFSFKYFSRYLSEYKTYISWDIRGLEILSSLFNQTAIFPFYPLHRQPDPSPPTLSRAKCGYAAEIQAIHRETTFRSFVHLRPFNRKFNRNRFHTTRSSTFIIISYLLIQIISYQRVWKFDMKFCNRRR